jgi:hypothetical protein
MQLHYLNFDQLSAPESNNIRVDYGEIQFFEIVNRLRIGYYISGRIIALNF